MHADRIRRLTSALRRALRRALGRVTAEEGFALVLALGMVVVLGAVGTTAISYATSNSGSSAVAKAGMTADALAEAALNDAYSVLYASGSPSQPDAVPHQGPLAYSGGTIEWWGTLDTTTNTWTLYGVGRIRNPTGAGEVVRTVHGKVSVVSGGTAVHTPTGPNVVWNYVYADSTSSCTTLANSVVVNVPLYVRGSLCMNNSASFTGYQLQVGGTLTLQNTASVGTSSSTPVHDAHIAGGCSVNGSGYHTPCGASDRVYSQVPEDNTTAALTKPPVAMSSWYENAQPGPMHTCTTGSFPGGFDNDTVMNHSRATVDLTPNTAYDCKVLDGAGNLVGEIGWTGGNTGTLTVNGTIFFDGDITFRNLVRATYQGRATIYSSGKITFSNNSQLCGVSTCDSTWDTSRNLLGFVAGGVDGSGVGFEVQNSSVFQGATYAVGDYSEGNSATVWGPIIANQIYLQNSTSNHYVPIGILLPGMPAFDVPVLQNAPGSWG